MKWTVCSTFARPVQETSILHDSDKHGGGQHEDARQSRLAWPRPAGVSFLAGNTYGVSFPVRANGLLHDLDRCGAAEVPIMRSQTAPKRLITRYSERGRCPTPREAQNVSSHPCADQVFHKLAEYMPALAT